MFDWLQQTINGLSLGAIYALIALGYTMVYGVLRFINFAHSDVMMLGAVAAYYLTPKVNGLFTPAGQPPQPSLAGALIVFTLSALICAAIGVTIEYLAYRPLRHRPRLTVLITAIGVSFIFMNLGLVWVETYDQNFPNLIADQVYRANLLEAVGLEFQVKDLVVVLITVPPRRTRSASSPLT